ncbi:MAG TPA: hypothetical protein DDZ89_20140 [Clostridiales bacterium]|nr:hypothetical protein [Clostridiales bacterium]
MKNIFNEQPLDCSSDAQIVISTLETCHPIFLLHEEIPGYYKAKTQYIEFTSKPISFTEFRLATLKYFQILNDSHTIIGEVYKSGMHIDINWFADHGKLYLLDREQNPTDIEIITIGGIPTSNVTAQVDMYYPAENEAARQYNYAMFCRNKEMLILAGCKVTSSGIEIDTSDDKTATYKLAPLSSENDYIIRYEMIGDVFYVDLKAFRIDKSVDEVGEEIKRAIQNGIKKFILDVRDNSGGNSNVGSYLLHVMGMNVPRFGVYIRHSELSRAQKNNKSDDKLTIIEPNKSTAVPNDDINLLVLTNAKSFSAAKMFGVWVQDGKLGKIVGQISRNKPNSYGDPLIVKLPFSKLGILVSHKKFQRPNTGANPDCLIPDIEVPFGDDVLTVALQYMASVQQA